MSVGFFPAVINVTVTSAFPRTKSETSLPAYTRSLAARSSFRREFAIRSTAAAGRDFLDAAAAVIATKPIALGLLGWMKRLRRPLRCYGAQSESCIHLDAGGS